MSGVGGLVCPGHVLMSILLLDMNGSAIYLTRRYSWSGQTTKCTKLQGARGSYAHAKSLSQGVT